MRGLFNAKNNIEGLEAERERIKRLSDIELGDDLERKWEEEIFSPSDLSPQEKELLYKKISSRAFPTNEREHAYAKPRWRRISATAVKYAAAIMLPLLACASIYLYHTSTKNIDCETIFSTGRGEMASIKLPDGTEVKVNNESNISYNPYSYVKGNRHMALAGEAFFSVAKDSSHPFSLSSGSIKVNVLGTKFNVYSRDDDDFASVYLQEGSVSLLADGASYSLRPNQKAIINKLTGKVTIVETKKNEEAIAWLNHEMVFNNAPLSDVLRTIERNYAVEFVDAGTPSMPKDGFTGTLPTNDISMVLTVLEDVYERKFAIKGRKASNHKGE